MRPILFDADAFNCIRAMSFLGLLRRAEPEGISFVMTEYVARHELHDVETDVKALESEKKLRIEPVSRRKSDPSGERFKKYKDEGMHKGEAESLAWVMGLEGTRPLFVSNDGDARKEFIAHGAPAGDVMDLIVEAIDSGTIDPQSARQVVSASWDDRPNNRCRPGDYTDFDATLARRRAAKGS